MEDSASNEAPKRWGFRRSTIARREFMEEIGNLDLDTLMPRRVAQQPRGRGRGRARGKQAGEGLPAASKRGRGRRRAGPDDSGPSPELHSEVFCAPLQPHLLQKTRSDLEASDSDELTLRELQERVRRQRKLQANSAGGRSASDLNPDVVCKANQEAEELSEELKLQDGASTSSSHSSSAVLTKDRKSARGSRKMDDTEEEEDGDDAGSDFGEDSDPNAVYCICRQAHNKRFMICCDRCQEWFHGDCVGISEARGLLLEKNGEDYICPACSPCPSPVGLVMQPALCKTALSSSSESLFSSSAGEERPSEDEAIKGKIRKASSHSSKRKIKFFQPVEVVSEAVELEKKDHKPAEDAVTVERMKEKAAGPQCIGPGCSNDALPESVYCGHQCIIRHAAVAMQGLSEPKPQPEIKPKPAAKPVLKIQNLGKLFRKKLVEKPADQENDGRKEKEDLKPTASTIADPDPDPDHKAQVEEQPAAIAPSVFYRTMKDEKEAVKTKADKRPLTPQSETPKRPASPEAPASETSIYKTAPLESRTSENAANSTGLSAPPARLLAEKSGESPATAETISLALSKEVSALCAPGEGFLHTKAERSAPSGGLESNKSDLSAQLDRPAAKIPTKPTASLAPPEVPKAENPMRPTTSSAPPEGPEAKNPMRPWGTTANRNTPLSSLSSSLVAEKCIRPPASLAQSEEPKTEKPLEPKALPGETVITQPSGSAFQSKCPLVQKTTGPSASLALLKEPMTEHPTPLAVPSSATSKGHVAEKPMIALASSQSMNLIAKKPITTLVSSDSLMTQRTPLIPSDLSASLELKMPQKPLIPPEGRVADKPIKPNASSAQLESPVAEKTVVTVSPSAPSLKNPLPSRAKKTMPGSPRLTGPKLLPNNAPQENKNSSAASKNPGQPPEASKTPRVSHPAPEPRVLPVSPAPVPPPRPLQAHPNMQIRQNIRRSLTETLLKRVSDSDDLDAPESKLEKLAVNIEREMFNMYYTTDNKYKTKFRSLLLSLKDPKNKGLLYQVVRGHITPFKLTRLSQEELLSVQACAANPLPVKEDVPPADSDVKEPPKACENKVVKADSIATSSSEDKVGPSVGRPAQPKKVSSAVSDIISSMLKDTTDEHKMHLFDLKCRICTGQISGAEDPEAKRFKKEEPKQEEEEGKPPCVVPIPGTLLADSVIVESPASPTTEDCSTETALPVFTPPVIPAISIVTITRRDPRTAAYRSISSASTVPTESTSATTPSPVIVPTPTPTPIPAVNPPQSVLTKPKPSDKEKEEETKAPEPRPLPPPPPVLKSILLKPSASTVPRIYDSSTSATRLVSSHSPTDNETKQETVWKGFLNMQSVAKFVTKGYAISGSSETLKKDMPDTIHIGGRILPQTVWEYVERVKTSVTKEMSLIRFCPGTDEEEIAYVSLFSYFNSRRRFGVVSNVCNNIKDLYLIPLGANQSIPSILLPLEGPGLEQNHPNLLIGLAICQKLKRPGLPSQDIDDKRPKIQMPQEPQDSTPPVKAAVPGVKDDVPYDPAIPFFGAPSGSPASLKAPDTFSSSVDALPGLSDRVKGTSSTTPLQTILKTLFGNSKQGSDSTVNACEPSSAVVKGRLVPPVPMVDPIVQQYQQSSKTITTEDFNNDSPYDPEEEYDPALEYQNLTPLKPAEILKPETQTVPAQVDDDRPYDPEEEYNLGTISNKSSETESAKSTSAPKDDVAYDPEDETVFEEVQNYLADHESPTTKHGEAATPSLSEQQKMLEELNRQIEEQKRLLAEQEEALRLQRAAVGVSMAHFSVSDALMSPPPSFGREPMETTESAVTVQEMNSSRDPRQYRTLSQNTDCNKNEAPTQSPLLSKTDQEDASVKLDKGAKDTDQAGLHSEASSKTSNRRSHSPSRSSSRSRRSDASRRERHSSSERRSRHDRRSYDRRTSYDSRDDRRHRRSRRSPERSSRRSRSRSHSRGRSSRQDRSSSRQRGQHRRGDTPRRRSSRDRHDSPRSRSSRTRTSARPEKGEDKEEKSASRRSTASESAQCDSVTQSSNLVTSEKPQTQPDESQNEASENLEQTKCTPKEEPSSVVSSLTPESNTLQIDTSSQEASDQQQSKDTREDSSERGDEPPNETNLTHQTNDQSLDPLQEKGSLSSHESEDKSHQPLQIQMDDFSESERFYARDYQEDLPQRPTRLDKEDSPAPEIKSPSINDNPPNIPLQNQNDTFREVEMDHLSYRNLPQLDAHSVARPESLHRNDPEVIPGNINPRDQFRPRASDLQWRGPRHSMDGPRCRTPLQPRMLRAPYHERFESCGSNYGGPRPQRQRPCINPGPSSDFGPGEDCPGVPRHRPYDDFDMPASNFDPRETSTGPEMFKGSGSQNFGPRGTGPDPRRFDGFSRHPSGPKGRIQRPGMFEDSGPHGFRQRGTSSDPEMCDGPYDFPGPPQPDYNDLREFNAPHQLDTEPFSDVDHPRGQWFDDQMFDSRESQPPEFNDLREYSRTPPFDTLESDNRGFEESRFSNLPPHHVRRQNPRCESPLNNKPEESQFFKTGLEIEGPNQCYTEPSSDNFKGGRIDDRMQCSRFNPPQNFRGQRVPSPHFHGQRMPAPQSKDLGKPCSSNLPSLMKFNVRQRPRAPIAGESQNLIRSDGPSGKPDIRPLRLSGPLLPTPPGGPLRFNNPRMPRPSPYDRPQDPPARRHMNEEVKPGCFDDNSNTQTGETSHSLIPDEENEEYGDDGEEYSGQEDSSPGRPWQSRPKRRRRRRRRQRFRSCSDERISNQGPGGRGRNREVTRNADRNRH